MAVKDGLPATDFSKMNRDYIRNVAEGETVKDGLPATDFSRMNREYIKAVVEEAGGGGGGGDFTTAEVTLVGDFLSTDTVNIFCANAVDMEGRSGASPNINIDGETTTVMKCILYKGLAILMCDNAEITASSGDVSVNDGIAFITGDCSLTIASAY